MMGPITRRQFLVGSGTASLGLLAGCERLPGQAQPPTPRLPRIGFLSANATGPGTVLARVFLDGLREHGYVDGQNVVVEWRMPNGPDDWASQAAELVRLPVDVIVAPPTSSVLAAREATDKIPIVFVTVGDPVGLGLVESLAHPGGNVTGVSSIAILLGQKRLELLKQAAPAVSRVACLYDAGAVASTEEMQLVLDAAGSQGVLVEAFGVQTREDLDQAFAGAVRLPADALLTTSGQSLLQERQRIAEFAVKYRLPSIFAWREAVASGGLMSYGPSLAAQFRRAAYYVVRILNGAKPADLPVEQPMTFELVVNMRTARELGLTFPPEISLQITEVIQ
jgi:putative ABC transport system substrate-binding protein